jgi:hypothetical protein
VNVFTAPQLRDLFAMHALAGLLAWSPPEHDSQYSAEDAARLAYRHADAMLAERERPAKADAPQPSVA